MSWVIGPQTRLFASSRNPRFASFTSRASKSQHNVKGMSQADLDFLLDAKANTIGALLYHLAATDHYYALSTFGGVKWGSWPDDEKKKWDIPMNLGDPARKAIKGNNLDYYLNILARNARTYARGIEEARRQVAHGHRQRFRRQ